jgi:hypothetical protein
MALTHGPDLSLPEVTVRLNKGRTLCRLGQYVLAVTHDGETLEISLRNILSYSLKEPSRLRSGALELVLPGWIFSPPSPLAERPLSLAVERGEYVQTMELEREIRARKDIVDPAFVDLVRHMASGNVHDSWLETFRRFGHQFLLSAYVEAYRAIERAGEFGTAEVLGLQKAIDVFGLSHDDVHYQDRLYPYVVAKYIRESEPLDTLELDPAVHGSLVRRPGEIFHFSASATLRELRVVSKGVRGGSVGIVLPLPILGASFLLGSTRAHVVHEHQWATLSIGRLMLSNLRVVLNPVGAHKPVSVDLQDILSYHCFANGVTLHAQGHDKPWAFGVENNSAVEVFGLSLGYLLHVRMRGVAPPHAALTAPAITQVDKYEQLRKIGELRSMGVLTDEEFDQEKARIMGGR